MHMHKKFEVNRTKIKGGCQSYTKAAPQQSWGDFTLLIYIQFSYWRFIRMNETLKSLLKITLHRQLSARITAAADWCVGMRKSLPISATRRVWDGLYVSTYERSYVEQTKVYRYVRTILNERCDGTTCIIIREGPDSTAATKLNQIRVDARSYFHRAPALFHWKFYNIFNLA